MSNCKYKTPCGICSIRTDADPTPRLHFCKAEEACETELPIPKFVEDKTYMEADNDK